MTFNVVMHLLSWKHVQQKWVKSAITVKLKITQLLNARRLGNRLEVKAILGAVATGEIREARLD